MRAFAALALPQREPGLISVRIERQHAIIEFPGRSGFLVKTHEVLNITARFPDMTRRVVRIERAVPHNDGLWFQRFDLIDGGEPGDQPLVVGLDEVGMGAVVDGVTRDNESDRRHMKAGGVIGTRYWFHNHLKQAMRMSALMIEATARHHALHGF